MTNSAIKVGQVWNTSIGVEAFVKSKTVDGFDVQFGAGARLDAHVSPAGENYNFILTSIVADVKDFAVGQVWLNGKGQLIRIARISSEFAGNFPIVGGDDETYTLSGTRMLYASGSDLVKLDHDEIKVGQIWATAGVGRLIINSVGTTYVEVTNASNYTLTIKRSDLVRLVEDIKDFSVGQVWVDGWGDEFEIVEIIPDAVHGIICKGGETFTLTGRYFALNDTSANLVRLQSETQMITDTDRINWLGNNILAQENLDINGCVHATTNMWALFAPKDVSGSARAIIDAAIAQQELEATDEYQEYVRLQKKYGSRA